MNVVHFYAVISLCKQCKQNVSQKYCHLSQIRIKSHTEEFKPFDQLKRFSDLERTDTEVNERKFIVHEKQKLNSSDDTFISLDVKAKPEQLVI